MAMPTVSLELGVRSYSIHIFNGALDRVGEFAYRNQFPEKIGLIADTNGATLYAERVRLSLEAAGFQVSVHIVNAGESTKCLQQVEELCNSLVAKGLDRSSGLVALGGGVIGDLVGFVASIYYRGIPFIQVPTTVTAQVDSSIGGKTAVNLPLGKNLIGAFHQPTLVVIDPTSLTTLPTRVLSEGLAEAIKHAVIRDADMLPVLRKLCDEVELGFSLNSLDQLPEIIARNVAIKARIVEADEEEKKDIRALLNFGHTIGHGIEASAAYGEIMHGEAVALGMRAALWLSHKYNNLPLNDIKSILRLLHSIQLPIQLPQEADETLIFNKTMADKKFHNGQISFILLRKLGEACVSRDISPEDIKEAIHHLKSKPAL